MPNYNFYGQTDKGKVRTFNDDVFGGFIHKDVLFIMVADGVGCKEGADAPSSVALHEMNLYITKYLQSDNPDHIRSLIEQGMYWANRVLSAYRRANDQVYSGTGTALTICAITKDKDIVVGHAGNTRLYLLRQNNPITQMTEDHTEAQALVKQNKLSKDEAKTHPGRGVLTKVLGAFEQVEPDFFKGRLQTNDIILLCTDGIYNLLSDSEMQDIIIDAGESRKACEWFIDAMNKRGGIDNGAAVISFIAF